MPGFKASGTASLCVGDDAERLFLQGLPHVQPEGNRGIGKLPEARHGPGDCGDAEAKGAIGDSCAVPVPQGPRAGRTNPHLHCSLGDGEPFCPARTGAGATDRTQ